MAAVVGTSLVGVGLIATSVVAATPAAADAPVRDGSSSTLAAASCWAIKQQNPSSASGIYWLQTSTLVDPAQFYCDQTTDGGGWVLVGRGRDGWNWSYNGQGTPASVRNVPSGTGAFAPATLSTPTINGLLDGTRVDALSDGIRVVRSTDQAGSGTQEMRIFAANRSTWSWAFGGGVNVSSISFNGTSNGSAGTTFSYTLDQGTNALVSYSTVSHNYRMGWGYGNQVVGVNSATSYIWSNTSEGNALPFTQVWLRPELSSSSYPTIPSGGLPQSTIRSMVTDQTSPDTPWGVTGVHGTTEAHVEVEAFAQIGNTMFVGGDFTTVQEGANPDAAHTAAQPYLAAFDVNTGEWVSSFRPQLDGIVWDLQALPNGELAVAGAFANVNGVASPSFAVLNPTTGATATDFSTSVALTSATASSPVLVRALDLQGSWLYLGGRFNRISGGIAKPLNNVVVGRMARVNVADGRPDGSWKPNFDGTIAELDASAQGDRVYVVGYFSTVNGASSPNEATISTSDNGSLVPGLGQWTPSGGSGPTAKYQQAIEESPDGYVWQGGSEHILEKFDRATYTLQRSYITRNGLSGGGGDIQTIAISNGVMYASCHCDNYVYSDDLSWANPLASNTDVDNINYIGAWDVATGAYLGSWWPSGLGTRQGLGAWQLTPDSNGCLWFGGDFTRGSYRNGAYQWLGGFGKFCGNDHTAPTVPTSLRATYAAGTGVTVTWGASTDASGKVTYEVLRGDRVVATTTSTSFVDTTASYPATYWVRAMDPSGNRSATTAGVTVAGPDTTPPSAPGGLTARAPSAASALLSWTASTDDRGVTGYVITRNGATVGTTPSTVTSFSDTTVARGTAYDYTVSAVDAAGNVSSPSATASVTTPSASPVLYSDGFTGRNGAALSSAWTSGSANGSVTVQNNAAALATNDVAGAYAQTRLTGSSARADSTLLMSYQWSAATASEYFSVYVRGSGGWNGGFRPKNGYGLQLNSASGSVQLQKVVAGTMTPLGNVAGGQSVSTAKQWLRLEVDGSTIRFRTWLDGQAEPTTWAAVVTDSSVTAAGQVYLAADRASTNHGAKTVSVDDLSVLAS